jgi:hypothetical protein
MVEEGQLLAVENRRQRSNIERSEGGAEQGRHQRDRRV